MQRSILLLITVLALLTPQSRASAQPATAGPRNVYSLLASYYGITVAPQCSVSFPTVGTSATRLLATDPSRFQVAFIDLGGAACSYAWTPNVTTTTGVAIGAAGGSAVENWQSDMVLPTYEHWMICQATGIPITIVTCDVL